MVLEDTAVVEEGEHNILGVPRHVHHLREKQ